MFLSGIGSSTAPPGSSLHDRHKSYELDNLQINLHIHGEIEIPELEYSPQYECQG